MFRIIYSCDMKKYTVVIVGAGPGGLACAKKLAENGRSVLVIEKNIQLNGIDSPQLVTAKEIGNIIPEKIIFRFFDSGEVFFGDVKKTARVVFPKKSLGCVNSAELRDYMTHEVQNAGAEIIFGRQIIEVKEGYVVDDQGEKYYYDFLVGADGSASVVRSYLGLSTKALRTSVWCAVEEKIDTIQLFCDLNTQTATYSWVLPHVNQTYIGATSLNSDVSSCQLRVQLDTVLALHTVNSSDALFHESVRNIDYQGFLFDNVFLVGDAAGISDAITGEGIYSAIISGQEAARKIISPGYSLERLQFLVSQKRKRERMLHRRNTY